MATGQTKTDFISYVGAVALQDAPKYGIKVVSPIIAQAIIESNWGRSGLATSGKNLFGIKCGSSWTGKSINMSTKEEYQAGVLTNIKANFRAYDSWEDSIHDYFKFISTKRYAALKNCTDALSYCTAIKNAGYATSSSYVTTLMQCIKSNNLDIMYDPLVQKTATAETTTPNITQKPKTYADLVNDVMNGLYGNGEDRKAALKAAGYEPNAIQHMVNQKCAIDDLTNKCTKYYNIVQKVKEVLTDEI